MERKLFHAIVNGDGNERTHHVQATQRGLMLVTFRDGLFGEELTLREPLIATIERQRFRQQAFGENHATSPISVKLVQRIFVNLREKFFVGESARIWVVRLIQLAQESSIKN